MNTPVFDSIEEATAYLNGPDFSYPSEITRFQGKDVLLIFKLSKSGSPRYKAISKGTLSASFKEHAVAVTKAAAGPTVKGISEAGKGNLFGMVKALFSTVNSISTVGQSEVDKKLLSNNSHAIYLAFEKAFQERQWVAFKHVESISPSRKVRPLSWFEREVDGQCYFMFKL